MNRSLLAAAVMAAVGALPMAAAAAEAAIVVRDAETGQLRAPTAAEAAALRGKSAQATGRASARAEAVVQRKLPHGAVAAEVPASLMQYTVVHRAADGSFTRACVQGSEQAAASAQRPMFAKPMTMARTARGMHYEAQ